jgi:proline racemase
MKSAFDGWNWQPPSHWPRIETIDMHTGGEPLRVYVSGLPPIEGNTVLEKRRYFREHYDHLRTGTVWEPRGHADMYGAVVTPSTDADFDVFFLHNEGYSTMCGHAIIALTTLAVETRRIKLAVMEAFTIEHPFEKDLSFLYGTIFTGPAQQAGHHSRNVCIFAAGELDRSPTGSGVSARAALHHARGDLYVNEKITIESILGSTMTVRAAELAKFGPYDAVIPEVGGTASITGRNALYFDPADPLVRGFIVR